MSEFAYIVYINIYLGKSNIDVTKWISKNFSVDLKK